MGGYFSIRASLENCGNSGNVGGARSAKLAAYHVFKQDFSESIAKSPTNSFASKTAVSACFAQQQQI